MLPPCRLATHRLVGGAGVEPAIAAPSIKEISIGSVLYYTINEIKFCCFKKFFNKIFGQAKHNLKDWRLCSRNKHWLYVIIQ
jgi:hypothetical protein